MSNLADATSTIIQLVLSRSSSFLNFFNNTILLPFGIVFSLFFFAGHIVSANGNFTLDSSLLNAAEKKYGVGARKRLMAWQQFVREDTSRTDMEKLEKVNRFFNQVNFVSDAIHWLKKDYWATPVEFLASGGGDCEDFALSKYFTLKMLGVPEKKLNLTYVKAWKLNQSHMVLTYYKTPSAVPLVLDNLINVIKPATQRPDLLPVYSFNGSGLWLSKERGRGNLVGKSDRLKLWNDLLERMPVSLQ
ncbi:MAG: transglutaminase-like cysteine peptidase [Proteobacteria bacterium]|nr:transglutaminase-like cysteine peptidase [Pseudomonadota bacterium]MBU1648876.1 transglutaminase-like cysteine peptidase [Pseudomonadota bacterium]MBU1985882.1 transglutaminase-like cysteine peptidase [Pseudomonadota bacterium]